MKKYTACIFAAVLLLLCACGASHPAPEQSAAPNAETVTTGTAAQETAAQPEQTAAAAPDETPQTSEDAGLTAVPETTDVPAEIPASAEAPDADDQAITENTPAPVPAPSETPAAPEETAAVTEPDTPYAFKTADTVLTVKGSALTREWYFTFSELRSIGGCVEADYFSRGKDPQELTQTYAGIDVQYLLGTIVGCTDYKKAAFRASDGYSVSYSRGAVGMSYINEMEPDAALKMILAWTEDGSPCDLRLVMGQQAAGEYNRTNWVRGVCEIELKAG